MSYTNKTPNFDLPQYVADDKPTYLGDFNKAMLDIDTALKNNENSAISAETLAQNANSTSSQALTTANTAAEDVEKASAAAAQATTLAQNAQTTASNAQTTASTANTTANSAVNTAEAANTIANTANSNAQAATSAVNALLAKIQDWHTISVLNTSLSNASLTLSYNTTLGIMQLYGYMDTLAEGTKIINVGTLPDNIRPINDINIQAGAQVFNTTTNANEPVAIKFNQNGTIVVPPGEYYTAFSNIKINVTVAIGDSSRWNVTDAND